MRTEIKIRNIELQLGTLEQERAKVAKNLTSIYKNRDELLLYIKGKIEAIEKLKEKAEEWKNKRIAEQKTTKDEILRRKGIIKSARNELKEIGVEKNKGIKKLEGLNFRIINAEKRIDDLIEQEGTYKLKQQDIDKLLKLEESIKKRTSNLAKANITLSKRNKFLGIDNSKKIEKSNKIVGDMEEQLKVLNIKVSKAQNQLDKLNIDTSRIKKDCDLYIKRAEKKYTKAFPKLKMKIK